MKKVPINILMVAASAMITTQPLLGQTAIDCFYPPGFISDYEKVFPDGYTPCEGSMTPRASDFSFVGKSVSLTPGETTSFVLQGGQCALFRTFPPVGQRAQLFNYQEGKLTTTEVFGGQRLVTVIDTSDLSEVSYPTDKLHDVQIYEDYVVRFGQYGNKQNVVMAVHRTDLSDTLFVQDTNGLTLGSYLPSHYWIDYGPFSADHRHANGFSFKDGWLAISSRHLNELSLERVGVANTLSRLRPYSDTLNNFRWADDASEGLYGMHNPKIISVSGDTVIISCFDNGNFRSWSQEYDTVVADIDDNNVMDTVMVPTLTAKSFSRGVVLEIDTEGRNVRIVKEYFPNGLFYGGAMGSFDVVEDSLYSFCYGLVDGEYPYSPFESTYTDSENPLFGLVDSNSGEKLFSGYYPDEDLAMYRFQAVPHSVVSQPEVECSHYGNGLFVLSAPNELGSNVKWSNGQTGTEIIVPTGSDYLFWTTSEKYNRVSKVFSPSEQACLITGQQYQTEVKLQIPTVLTNEDLDKYLRNYNGTLIDLQGRVVTTRPAPGWYIITSSDFGYAGRHLLSL